MDIMIYLLWSVAFLLIGDLMMIVEKIVHQEKGRRKMAKYNNMKKDVTLLKPTERA